MFLIILVTDTELIHTHSPQFLPSTAKKKRDLGILFLLVVPSGWQNSFLAQAPLSCNEPHVQGPSCEGSLVAHPFNGPFFTYLSGLIFTYFLLYILIMLKYLLCLLPREYVSCVAF